VKVGFPQIQGGCGCDLVDKVLNLDLDLLDLLDSKTLGRTPHLSLLFVRTKIKLFLSLPFVKYCDTRCCKALCVLGLYIALIFFTRPFIPDSLY